MLKKLKNTLKNLKNHLKISTNHIPETLEESVPIPHCQVKKGKKCGSVAGDPIVSLGENL